MENSQIEDIKTKLTLKKYKKSILKIAINIRRSNMFFNITSSKGNTLQQFSCANFEIRHSKKRKPVIRFDIMQEFARELQKHGIKRVKLRFTNQTRGFKRVIKAFRREKIRVFKNISIAKYKPHNGCPIKHKKRLGRSRKKRIARLKNRFLRRKITKNKEKSNVYLQEYSKLTAPWLSFKKFQTIKKKKTGKILFGPSLLRVLMKFRTKAKHRMRKKKKRKQQQKNNKKITTEYAALAKNIKEEGITKNFYQTIDVNLIKNTISKFRVIKHRFIRALDTRIPLTGFAAKKKIDNVLYKKNLQIKKIVRKREEKTKIKERKTSLTSLSGMNKNKELITKIKNELTKKVKRQYKKKLSKKEKSLTKIEKHTGQKITFSKEKIITPKIQLLNYMFQKHKKIHERMYKRIYEMYEKHLSRLFRYRRRKYYIALFKYRKMKAPTHSMLKDAIHSTFSLDNKTRISLNPYNTNYTHTEVQHLKYANYALYRQYKDLPDWLPLKKYRQVKRDKKAKEEREAREYRNAQAKKKFVRLEKSVERVKARKRRSVLNKR
jgi:ribosomal protein S11